MATMETNETFGYISSLLLVRMETIKASTTSRSVLESC